MVYENITNLRGPAGYNATGAVEDLQTLADYTRQTAGPNAFAEALTDATSAVAADAVSGSLDPLVIHRATLRAFKSEVLTELRASLAAVRTAACTIVTAGDSVTFGANATPGNMWVEKLNGYLSAAYQTRPFAKKPIIRLEGEVTGPPSTSGVQIYNAGVNGARSENYLGFGFVPKITALKAALVIHTVGFNDWRNSVTPAVYKANVKTRIDQIRAGQTAPLVQLLVHSFEHSDAHGPAAWHEYGTALEELAASYPSHVAFIDLSGPFYASGVPGADPQNLVDTDNLHPTDAGHELLARLIFETITAQAPAVTSTPVAPGPTIYAADTYAAADGALTTTEVGNRAYSFGGTSGGSYARSSNRLACTKLANGVSPIAMINTFQSDGIVSLDLVSAGSDGVIFRAVDSSNYWMVAVNAGVYKLYKLVAAAFTVVGTSTVVPAANDKIKVTLNGANISAAVNGVPVAALSTTDSFNQAATNHGAWVGGSVARTALFDNFEHRAAS